MIGFVVQKKAVGIMCICFGVLQCGDVDFIF